MAFPLFVLTMGGIACVTMTLVLLTQRHALLSIAIAIAGATAALLVHGLVHFDYYADDSFITLRYARHLADGLGPNWNSTGHVEGYTSFSWMALLAALDRLGVDIVNASRVLGFLSIMATFAIIALVWRLWRDAAPGSGVESPVLPAAAMVGLALVDAAGFWGFSGMETPFYMALLTGSACLFMREQRRGGPPLSALAFAAAAMTRPEGVLAAAVTGAFAVAQAVRRPEERWLYAASWAGVFIAFYGSYFAWRFTYYGYLLPNTYYAKVGLTMDGLDRGLRYITASGLQYHLLALFTGIAALTANEGLRGHAAYLSALCGALVAAVVVEGGGDVHARFLLPVLPLLLIGGLAGVATLLRRAALAPSQTALIGGVGLVLGAMALLPASYDPLVPLGPRQLEQRRLLGAWLNDNAPSDYTVGDFQIGATAYYGIDLDFLDLLGLNDVTIAHSEVDDFGAGVPGHEKYNVDYVLDDARPEIIVAGRIDIKPLTSSELRDVLTKSSLLSASSALFNDPRLWERYSVRAVEIDGIWYHFLQRNDTVAQLQAPELH